MEILNILQVFVFSGLGVISGYQGGYYSALYILQKTKAFSDKRYILTAASLILVAFIYGKLNGIRGEAETSWWLAEVFGVFVAGIIFLRIGYVRAMKTNSVD